MAPNESSRPARARAMLDQPSAGPMASTSDLRAVVAQAAKLRGELLRRELPAPAVEQDENGHSTGGLAIQPCEQRGLGAVRLGLAGEEARGAGKEIRRQSSGSAGLGARAGWGDGREDKLHPMRVLQDVKEKHPGNMDLLDNCSANHKASLSPNRTQGTQMIVNIGLKSQFGAASPPSALEGKLLVYIHIPKLCVVTRLAVTPPLAEQVICCSRRTR